MDHRRCKESSWRLLQGESQSTFGHHVSLIINSTRRAFHLADLVIHLLFVLAFTSYLLEQRSIFRDDSFGDLIDYRVYFIVIQSAARSLTSSQLSRAPFFITFLAFIWKLIDSAPGSSTFCFFLAQLSYFMHVMSLLLPLPASPVLLFPRSASLRLSSMLLDLLVEVLAPVILFIFPVSILFFFMAVFLFLAVFLFTMAFYALYLAFISALRSSGSRHAQYFFRIVRHYSEPNFFPAPLNLLSFVLVSLPSYALCLCRQRRMAARLQETVKPFLWRLIAMPWGLLFGIAWLWRRS